MATQGLHFPPGNWVTQYAVNYSCDGKTWQSYKVREKRAVSWESWRKNFSVYQIEILSVSPLLSLILSLSLSVSLSLSQILTGNSDSDTVVKFTLQAPLIARLVRIVALEWNPIGLVCMRVETYGCYLKDGKKFLISFSSHSTNFGMKIVH